MQKRSFDPGEIEVEAEFYFIQDNGNPSASSAQLQLANVMTRRGYDVLHQGQRVWEYIFQNPQPSPRFWWRLKQKVGLANKSDKTAEQSIEALKQLRDDHPYRVKFRFIPTSWENGDEGYVVEVECIPALRDKLDRLGGSFEDTNLKGTVRTCKSELRDIATEVGFSTLREPFTRAENHEPTLEQHLRKQLQEYEYGSYVTQFADDADEALRYSLTRPAISAYVHGIEWAIICYLAEVENRDLIEEEGYGRGKGFKGLISEIEDTGQVKQVTSEALRQMNTERVWMAHHKEGEISEVEVRRVKQRFSILLEELFL
ncbi:hypothetical protein PM035_10510 [Halorubrum ezzemoulense]|uniref:hypothetical protein n=1 Tax=Halorubrum ezzemoulense TaxID=337243 RepID=UPI00232C9B6D|nr:hypothetical protein [Halorubrum ezzemoulense]MDB2261385.1 hypothetical protein [Halorubrum ezzemoulense]MDB2268126.1 hypothetical protein [Halorubrum ezzemoulense]